jgi:multidrug transporter EmrE-like cation transporter
MYLFIAIVSEVLGSTFFRLSKGFEVWQWGVAAVGMFIVSLVFLGVAMKDIPLTVSYPIWAGLGTVMTVIIGMTLFQERLSAGQWVGLVFAISGAIMLKVLAPAVVE